MEKVDVNALIEASLEEPEEAQEEPTETVEETVEEETAPTADETEEVEEVEDEESDTEEVEDEEEKPVPLKALKDERQKRQELEKRLEEIQKGIEGLKPQEAPKDIYEAFDRDPKGVTRDLNAEIARLSSDDPYANAAQIEQLRDLKSELTKREVVNIQKTLQQQTKVTEVVQKLNQAVPGFNQKAPVLEEFAKTELGYTSEDLQRLTSFDNPDATIREVMRINKLYERFNAKPEKKVVKKKPTEVEGAGKGIQKKEATREELVGRVIESGGGTEAWAKYFEDIGLAED